MARICGRESSASRVIAAALTFVAVVGSVRFVAAADAAAASSPSDARLALLVGVQEYPKLGPAKQLDGSGNDVQAMKTLLVERFRFQPGDIVTLINRDATSERIRRELAGLAERVHALAGDGKPVRVVFHFSGHGSQMPDQPEGHPDCDEEDGLDETLVPYDAEQQGGDQDIRDDELNRFVDRIGSAADSRAWIVLDCCHSGTGVRGATKIRKLDRAVAPAVAVSGDRRRIVRKRLPENAVFLSACRANEVEPEYRDGNASHGLLTRFLTKLLSQETSLSSLSYDILCRSIASRYQQEAVLQAPTPQLEGTQATVRSPVLAADGQLDRKPYWRAESAGNDRGRVKLVAGNLHGVTAGSLYELYESPDEIAWSRAAEMDSRKQSLAWVQIEQVHPATADATVFRWADADHSQTVPGVLPPSFRQGYAVERFHQHGDFSMRVRVVKALGPDRDGPPLSPGAAGVPEPVQKGLESARRPDESEWLRWVAGDAPCDVVVRFDGSYAAIVPATGVASVSRQPDKTRGAVPASLRGGWGPLDLRVPSESASQLADYLRRIARARNLIRVAATQSTPLWHAAPRRDRELEHAAERRSTLVDLQLVAVELNNKQEITSTRPWPSDPDQPPVMHEGDLFALQATNRDPSGKPVYVTVLVVDPDMEIQAVLPAQEGEDLVDEQRLDPGADRISDPYQCTAPPGRHYAILLATPQFNEFYRLAQPRLPKARSTDAGPGIDELFLEQMYFQTRGSRRTRPQKLYDDSWSSAMLQWEAEP
ncbi:MAG: caspase family protein [Pirellulales bacterium]|nr:caspase family protein [Pirellulales bacterium]